MKSRLSQAQALADPWETGKHITARLSWGPSAEEIFEWEKVATWRAPALDAVVRLRLLSRSKTLLKTPKPDMFMLSVLDTGDEDVEKFSRYFVCRDGLYKVLHGHIPVESERTRDEDLSELQESMVFALDHGLIEPDEHDEAVMNKILEAGYLDGTY